MTNIGRTTLLVLSISMLWSGVTTFPSRHLETILEAPDPFDDTKAYTLLVALHGNGGTGPTFAPSLSSVRKKSLLIAVPQGRYPKTAGGYSWFYETTDRSLWESYDTESAASVVGLVGELKARYRIRNVFVLGFSQGATLAYMVGLRNPGLVTGVAAIGGKMPEIGRAGSVIHAEDVAAARKVRLFIAHGVSDKVIGMSDFVAQRTFFVSNRYEVTAHEFDGGHDITDDVLRKLVRWMRLDSP